MTTLPTVHELFPDPYDAHACNDSCDTWCPTADREDPDRYGVDIMQITIHGREYLTDQYAAIRADLVAPYEHTITINASVVGKDLPVPPEEMPPPSTRRFQAARLVPLIDRGYTVHDSTGKHALVYDGTEHVGWIAPYPPDTVRGPGVTIADLPRAQALAAAYERDNWPPYLQGGNDLDMAAMMLNEITWLTSGAGVDLMGGVA